MVTICHSCRHSPFEGALLGAPQWPHCIATVATLHCHCSALPQSPHSIATVRHSQHCIALLLFLLQSVSLFLLLQCSLHFYQTAHSAEQQQSIRAARELLCRLALVGSCFENCSFFSVSEFVFQDQKYELGFDICRFKEKPVLANLDEVSGKG